MCKWICIKIIDKLHNPQYQFVKSEEYESILLENFTEIFFKSFLFFKFMDQNRKKLGIKWRLLFSLLSQSLCSCKTLINGKKISYEIVTLFSTDESVLIWSFKRKSQFFNFRWLDFFFNQLQKLIGKIFINSATAFRLIKRLNRNICLNRSSLNKLQKRCIFLEFSLNGNFHHFEYHQL